MVRVTCRWQVAFDERGQRGLGFAAGGGGAEDDVVAIQQGRDGGQLRGREVAVAGKERGPGAGEAGFEDRGGHGTAKSQSVSAGSCAVSKPRCFQPEHDRSLQVSDR